MKTINIIFFALVLVISSLQANELREMSIECIKGHCQLRTQFKTDKNLPGYFFEAKKSKFSLYIEETPSILKYGSYQLKKEKMLVIKESSLDGVKAIEINIDGLLIEPNTVQESLKGNIFVISWKSKSKLSKRTLSKLVSTNHALRTKPEKNGAELLENFANKIPENQLNPEHLFVLKPSKIDKVTLVKGELLDPNSKKVISKIMPGEKVVQVERGNDNTLIHYKSKRYLINSKALKSYLSLSSSEEAKLKSLALSLVEKKKNPQNFQLPSEEKKKSKQGLIKKKLNKEIKLDNKTYKYASFGKKDPFLPFFDTIDQGMNIDAVRIVGIIWEDQNPIAILEEVNGSGASYTLKENDPIQNGKVFKITPREVIFELTEFGMTRRFAMQLPKLEHESKK